MQGIVVSHFHFDHWQLADRLSSAFGAWVALSRAEYSWIAALEGADLAMEARERFRSWGVPAGEVEELVATEDYGEGLHYGTPDLLFEDGETVPGIPGLRVLVTPGHSPGHLCLYDEDRDLVFSGDHVLPRITPYVAMNPYGPANPLRGYLDSLHRLRRYASAEVLPAHEYRFTGLPERITELETAVAHRLREVREAVARDRLASPWAVAHQLTWSRNWQRFNPQARKMALSETVAHLALLAERYAPASVPLVDPVHQLPQGGQQHCGEQTLDHPTHEERGDAEGDQRADVVRHPGRGQHQTEVGHPYGERHQAGAEECEQGQPPVPVPTALGETADHPCGEHEAHDVPEGRREHHCGAALAAGEQR